MRAGKSILYIAALWRGAGGEQDWSNSEAPTSAEVEAVGEGEFEAKAAS